LYGIAATGVREWGVGKSIEGKGVRQIVGEEDFNTEITGYTEMGRSGSRLVGVLSINHAPR
jgi:hypothetical protein